MRGGVVEPMRGAGRRGESRRRFGVEPPCQVPGQKRLERFRKAVGADPAEARHALQIRGEPGCSIGRQRIVGKVRPGLAFRLMEEADAVAPLRQLRRPRQPRQAQFHEASGEQRGGLGRRRHRLLRVVEHDRAEPAGTARGQRGARGVEAQLVGLDDVRAGDLHQLIRIERRGEQDARGAGAADDLGDGEVGRSR